jgi:hypothetical protein
MTQNLYVPFSLAFANGEIDYLSDTFKCALFTDRLQFDFLTTTYSDSIPGQVVTSGYTIGGVTLTGKSISTVVDPEGPPSGTYLFWFADPAEWAALGPVAGDQIELAVVYDDTHPDKVIMAEFLSTRNATPEGFNYKIIFDSDTENLLSRFGKVEPLGTHNTHLSAYKALSEGESQFVDNDIKIALFNVSHTFDPINDESYSDLTGESVGNGYTEGGLSLTGKSVQQVAIWAVPTSDNPLWNNLGAMLNGAVKRAVIYDNDHPTKAILSSYEVPEDETPIGDPYTITWESGRDSIFQVD